ncbi:hypothetical protein PHIM7_45 [Sinorhizobium phage phiM7]|uniref:Uncharacterized protein n=2 Tax=Emdodecavirus TaxID=1980937 RepID=S5MAQ2_9CAUD|nr:hypothetical protein AB690_gp051 [Sinorhizobium phage phiM12]YP_009601170.1 hypothetical protein FDH46_gp045 [Sinorhizobium phage phiM7]AGR47693.1 hypothetical protein SmphiM12_061 [Sinorhizobium phage phiM12]AKF12593.1 hypothetical protein PHIM7_45 [Sinorhizobium phage phiM7]AKF12953.1 hypothetical protein PHIM19_46 [Sinorhizobium phage phiM19]
MKDKIEQALQLLREARNNMLRHEFEAAVKELCDDEENGGGSGNVLYPLLTAGMVALELHRTNLKAHEENIQ